MNALQRRTLAVLELDDHTCQLCGTVKHLDAHHITPRSQNKALQYDPSNGITLCRRDHMYFEAHRHEFTEWLEHWKAHGRLAAYYFVHAPPNPRADCGIGTTQRGTQRENPLHR